MKNWVLWNNRTRQRILNIDTGAHFEWQTGNKWITYLTPNGVTLESHFETPEEAGSEWSKIKETIFTSGRGCRE